MANLMSMQLHQMANLMSMQLHQMANIMSTQLHKMANLMSMQQHQMANIISVLARPFLQGAAPALVRVTPCPYSLFVAAPCPL